MFYYKGRKFALAKDRVDPEKRVLLSWNNKWGFWNAQTHVKDKADAMEYIKKCEAAGSRMFAEVHRGIRK